jgi:hypothetical protein
MSLVALHLAMGLLSAPLVHRANDLQPNSTPRTQHRPSAPRGYHHGTNRRPSAGNVRQQLFLAYRVWSADGCRTPPTSVGVHEGEFSRRTVAKTRKDGSVHGALVSWRGCQQSFFARAALICSSPEMRYVGRVAGMVWNVMIILSDNTSSKAATGQCNSDVPPPISACVVAVVAVPNGSQQPRLQCCTAPRPGGCRSFFGFYLCSPHRMAGTAGGSSSRRDPLGVKTPLRREASAGSATPSPDLASFIEPTLARCADLDALEWNFARFSKLRLASSKLVEIISTRETNQLGQPGETPIMHSVESLPMGKDAHRSARRYCAHPSNRRRAMKIYWTCRSLLSHAAWIKTNDYQSDVHVVYRRHHAAAPPGLNRKAGQPTTTGCDICRDGTGAPCHREIRRSGPIATCNTKPTGRELGSSTTAS